MSVAFLYFYETLAPSFANEKLTYSHIQSNYTNQKVFLQLFTEFKPNRLRQTSTHA